jgi:Domain of unknown function (DUF4338)
MEDYVRMSPMPDTRNSTLNFCGHTLTDDEVSLIRQIIADYPKLSQNELSATICELLDWKRPNGGIKTRECYLFLQQLQQRGWLESLPELRTGGKKRGPCPTKIEPASDPQPLITGPLANYLPLELRRTRTPEQGHLFRQWIHRYHYMGWKVPYGASLRYIVHCKNPPHQPLACLLFKSAGWRMAPRDQWIGWSDEAREANLQRVVNNSRFLIFPWVEIKNLASHILSLAAHQVVHDWEDMYKARPVLMETLVDRDKYPGICYHAANWIGVGITQGRGRMDRYNESPTSRKDILMYPLARKWREILNNTDPNRNGTKASVAFSREEELMDKIAIGS